MCWVWLFLAILLEVAATVCMKVSGGFSKLIPTITMTLLYGFSFLLLALALKRMDVGIAYAVWSAVGTALVATVGIILFHESVNPMKVTAITLIIVGVVFLNLSSQSRRNSSEAESRTRSQLLTGGDSITGEKSPR